ncbi:protein GRAVITROPIC IN THE LIGHT 1 [Impatiens glandulifera]|uniref:protein GRAVITROPIC IN THE LIGHT 1 n=1 Tax=Impatiens glandulifera TaxID=253017 RepID=UPI001FB0AEF6|nr:protein GRAVITROPIC IN THE LIGHT 1 [Impatiens glandulifera]
MDASTKSPQISEMWQKFALAFKTKTIEFFADEDDAAASAAATDTEDGFSLLDSAEEFITDQKVVVLKPDKTLFNNNNNNASRPSSPLKFTNTQFVEPLLSSIFATISSFEASYLQLQTAHVPFDEDAIVSADKTLVSHLQRLYDVREWYKNFRRNPSSCLDLPIGSYLEVQVQENQSKLRRLETIVNQLQSAIDDKNDQVSSLRQQLSDIHNANMIFSKEPSSLGLNSSGILLTIRVFDSMLHETSRSLHKFSMILIDLMKKAGWDLNLTANSVFSGVNYAKKGHNRYSILSYVSLTMFRGFDSESFGLESGADEEEEEPTEKKRKNSSLKQLIEHVASSPMEILRKTPNCKFSRFCETKYQNLVHPAMEKSIFCNLEQNEMVLDSWLSISGFYESFIKMSSSLWLLHKLAYSFDPIVKIFQVDRDADFSIVYMEDVTRKIRSSVKSRPKVAFTVIPGFKIGNTIIQSQVYLST